MKIMSRRNGGNSVNNESTENTVHYSVYCLPSSDGLSNSYTMGCPPVRGDNPRALASGLSYVQVDNPWYNYFIPPSSV